jgi:hypothetical protein
MALTVAVGGEMVPGCGASPIKDLAPFVTDATGTDGSADPSCAFLLPNILDLSLQMTDSLKGQRDWRVYSAE